MTPMVRRRLADPRVLTIVLMASVAIIPAFIAAPGLIPSDSKLGLYLDPASLISAARWAYDPQLFAGAVPHQQIGFVWPAGPWFWLGDQLGLSTWVVHRLWITGLLTAAGTGVAFCARRLGLSWTAAVCAGVMYELSPYVLAYVSRTSVMLLPWAGLGWIVGLTVMASRTQRWREPAMLALVIMTVAGVNATAILMIAPAPILWLIHATSIGVLTRRAGVAVAGRIAVLSGAVSAWWLAMLMIQRRAGANVLAFSETLTDVSTSSTAPEVLRGLGYWLFYIRDAFGATTEASLPHLGRTSIIALNFAFVIAGFAAVATISWAHRRFAVLLIATGVILAVGVHPIDDPAPMMSLLVGPESESAIAIALRSSTRAVPMVVLGLALALAARIAVAVRPPTSTAAITTGAHAPAPATARTSLVIGGIFIGLVILNLPAWWTGGFVDPNLQRRDPPPSWGDTAEHLNARPGDHRVLQVPGTEFGTFRWGHTNDQPLTWMVERPLITRDLLPLGSPAIMDLIYALDDRIQNQTLEPASVPAIARLLGIDSIWVTNDVAHERYRSAPPESLSDALVSAADISRDHTSTSTIVNRADPPRLNERSISDDRIGAPVPDVELLVIDQPLGVVRIGTDTVAMVGSGDGLIDLAAAGLIDGSETIITDPEDLPEDPADHTVLQRLLITDSNRSRPRHWRTSQDTTGATESADPELSPMRSRPGDARLDTGNVPQVTAEQQGPVRATATDYGPRFSYQPEYRPAMAIDGDSTTAWMVSSAPVGQTLRLLIDDGLDSLGDDAAGQIVIQQVRDSSHMITEVVISADGTSPFTVELNEDSLATSGQRVTLPTELAVASVIDIEISAVAERDPETLDISARTSAVGFSRVDVAADPTIEVVELAEHGWFDALSAPFDTTVVLTRLRSDPMNRERADPERRLIRRFDTASDGRYSIKVEIGIDPRSSDEELIRLTGGRAVSSQRLRGSLNTTASAAFDADPTTAWVSPFAPAGALWIDFELDTATDTITITQPSGDFSTISEIRISDTMDASIHAVEAPTSTIMLDEPIGPGPVRIEITEIAPAMAVEYASGAEVTLPVAISEIAAGSEVLDIPAETSSACRDDLLTINGEPVPITLDSVEIGGGPTGASVMAKPCVESIELDAEDNLLIGHAPGALRVDRVVISETAAPLRPSLPAEAHGTAIATPLNPTRTLIEVTGCADGCWLIHGHGHNPAWRASIGGVGLGEPASVSGGLNAWYLDGTLLDDGAATVELSFTAQRWLDLAWVITAVGLAISLIIIVRSGRRRLSTPAMWSPRRPLPSQTSPRPIATIVAIAVLSALAIGPVWGVVGLAAGLLAYLRERALEWFATVLIAAVAVWIAVSNRIERPPPDLAWPTEFSIVHPLALFAVVVLAGATLFASDATEARHLPSGSDDGD